MGRTEYYHDPHAPKANSLIPASNLLVVDETGAILLHGAATPDSGPFPVAPRTSGKPQPSARSGNVWKRPESWPRSPGFLVYTPTRSTSSPTAR